MTINNERPPMMTADIRKNAENLRLYVQSVIDQIKEAQSWGGHYGVEKQARDALDLAFRIAASVTTGLTQIADALDALATKEQSND